MELIKDWVIYDTDTTTTRRSRRSRRRRIGDIGRTVIEIIAITEEITFISREINY